MNKGKTYVKNSPVLINASSILYEGGVKTLDKLFDLVYPVGSVYMSTNSTSPQILFGGSWTKIEGRFLWATGSTPGTTGGSRTTDSHILTIDEMPTHYHMGKTYSHNWNAGVTIPPGRAFAQSYRSGTAGNWAYSAENWIPGSEINDMVETGGSGGGQGHTHTFMPPYFEVYMWYRTA